MRSEWLVWMNLSSLACPNKAGMNVLGATCQHNTNVHIQLQIYLICIMLPVNICVLLFMLLTIKIYESKERRDEAEAQGKLIYINKVMSTE